MNRYVFSFFLFLFFCDQSARAAADVPASVRGSSKELNLRAFYKINDSFTSVASAEIKDPSFDVQEKLYLFGTRYSLSDNIKLGLFAGYVQNRAHNDNWVKQSGSWKWNHIGNNEMIYYPEFSYRNLLGDLVYELKIKYVYSTIFNEKDFFTKLNLIYNFTPKFFLITSDEVKFSLTNKEKSLSENWVYLIPFYKVTPKIMLGPSIGYFKKFWTTSSAHKALRTNTYVADESAVSVGLNINFYL